VVGKTDQEQIDDLKEWWEKHGKFILIGIVFLIAGVVGGQVWMDFDESKKLNASVDYSAMMQEMQDGDIDSAMQRASALIEKNAESAYAPLAALALAKMEVNKGELDSARLRLQWTVDNSEEPALIAVAKLRLAKVLLALDKPDEAMSQVSGNLLSSFDGAYAIVRGDIFFKKGELDLAKTAYLAALDDSELSPQLRRIVQLKLDDLGVDSTS
jgi:predicted negative regulator of RcsB-dependent stress response